jgi:hypothetical protein
MRCDAHLAETLNDPKPHWIEAADEMIEAVRDRPARSSAPSCDDKPTAVSLSIWSCRFHWKITAAVTSSASARSPRDRPARDLGKHRLSVLPRTRNGHQTLLPMSPTLINHGQDRFSVFEGWSVLSSAQSGLSAWMR